MKLVFNILNRIALLFIISLFFSCETEETPSDDGKNSVDVPSVQGVWVRTLGASGDRTDIAIGGIANEPSNRVYMCEYKGVVGLYKGYLNGSTITWDATHGLPNASAKKVGAQLEFYYPSVSGSLPTLYDRGSWSNRCGSLQGGDNNNATTGRVLFWTQKDHGCGNITVTINDQIRMISSYFSGGAPDCGVSGGATFELPGGTYNFSASCSNYTWNGSITITNGGCFRMQLN